MASTFNNTVPYIGITQEEFFTNLYYGAPTTASNSIYFLQNIKKIANLPLLSTDIVARPWVCGDTTTPGSATLSNAVIEVCKFKIFEEFCNDDFRELYDNARLFAIRPGSNNDRMPQSYEDELVRLIGEQTVQNWESQIWRSSTYDYPSNETFGCFDGFYRKIDEDANISTSLGNLIEYTSAFSTSNIISRLNDFYTAIHPLLLDRHNRGVERLSIHLPPEFVKFLNVAVSGSASTQIGAVLDRDANGNVIGIFGIPFVQSHAAWATPDGDDARITLLHKKMFVGTDLAGDVNSLRVIDLNNVDGRDYTRIVGSYKLGVQYIYPEYMLHAKVDLP